MLMESDFSEESKCLVGAQFASPRHEGSNVLGQATPAEPYTGLRNLRPMRSSKPMASASRVTSAPAASQSSAMAFMNEILVAKNELAAVLTNSAVDDR